MNPLQMASLSGFHSSPDVSLGKFPSTQNHLFGPRHHHRIPWTYAVSRPDPATLPVPCSWPTRMLARTYSGHNNYYRPQSQSGVGLRIIHQWNLLRIPFSWLLGEGSFGDGGRRASLSRTPTQAVAFCVLSLTGASFCSLPFKVNAT